MSVNDDEREVREWLSVIADIDNAQKAVYARTILALLDRPTLPEPEDVPDNLIVLMCEARRNHAGDGYSAMRAALKVYYDRYAKPAPRINAADAADLALQDALTKRDGVDVYDPDQFAKSLAGNGYRIVEVRDE